MNILFKIINQYLYKGNYFVFLLKISIIFFVLNIITGILSFEILGIKSSNNYTKDVLNKNPIFYFSRNVIFAPLLETTIFQWFPIFLYKNIIVVKKSKHKILFTLLSSLIFGLLHNYDAMYQIRAFIAGIYLITIGIFLADKEKDFFTPIFVIHSFNNLILFLLKTSI